MHFIRRTALRAASSPTPFVFKSRSVTTSSPFILRAKTETLISTSMFRRFTSDNAADISSTKSEQGTVSAAVESTKSITSDSIGTLNNAANETSSIPDLIEPKRFAIDKASSPRGSPFGSVGGPTNIIPNSTIYVGNLVFDLTAEDLRNHFSSFGNIQDCTIASDVRGLSKGFAYITFENTEQATAAIQTRNQTVFEGRRLIVNYRAKNNRVPQTNEPSKTLFIGNLAFEMSDADLNNLFREVRNVVDVRVAIDRRTGQPRGFAHADFVTIEDAERGKEYLKGKEVYGRALRVDFSASSRNSKTRENL